MTETILPDQTVIKTIRIEEEDPLSDEPHIAPFSLIERMDYTIVGVKSCGETIIISSNERDAISKSYKTKLGKDQGAYVAEMFTMAEDRRPGLFTANVGSDLTKVWMRDNEGNYFELDN